MFAYKLTSHSNVLNIASSCCYTFLLGRNDEYDANCVTTTIVDEDDDDGVGPVWGEKYEFIEPSSRWFINQWSDEQRAKLLQRKSMVDIWFDADGTMNGSTGWNTTFERHVAAMNAPIELGYAAKTGETFDQILQSCNGTVVVVSEN